MSSSRYDTTLAAISFFSFDAEKQISIVERHFDQEVPAMLSVEGKGSRHSDVLMSIACIYYTARGGFVEKYEEDDEVIDLYENFHHRLTWALGDDGEVWSVQAVRNDEMWANLRRDAQKLLDRVGRSFAPMEVRFDLLKEFSPAEFVTSKEQGEHIDYLLSSPENDRPDKI